jgi:hypothetical protein
VSTPAVASELHKGFFEDMGPQERSALLAWCGFIVTFAAARTVTYSVRAGRGPCRNVSLGKSHLHHYLWGIALLGAVGAIAVRGSDETRRHPVVALCYGTGSALIVDEFALLLDLEDVYWARQGRVSVDLGVGLAAAGGTAFAAKPVLLRLYRYVARKMATQ